jgi:hypothetical protein
VFDAVTYWANIGVGYRRPLEKLFLKGHGLEIDFTKYSKLAVIGQGFKFFQRLF